MIHHIISNHSGLQIPPRPSELNKSLPLPLPSDDVDDQLSTETPCLTTAAAAADNDRSGLQVPPSDPRRSGQEEDAMIRRRPSPGPEEEVEVESTAGDAAAEVNGRERLKRHRVEVAGRVPIPEIWGQEELLKDWIDCSAFDASLANSKIMSARAAMRNVATANGSLNHL